MLRAEPRMRAGLALPWAVAVAALALVVVSLVLRARNDVVAPGELYIADLWLAVLGPVTGASLLTREPRSRVGFLLLSTALIALGSASGNYATYALSRDVSLPGASLGAWVVTWTWVPVLALPMLLPLVYPSGTGPRPRWLFAVAAADIGVLTVLSAVHPGHFDSFPLVGNPLGLGAAPRMDAALGVVLTVSVLVLIPGSLLAGVLRWRRSVGDVRFQLGWFLCGDAVFVVAFLTPVRAQPWADLLAAAGYTALLGGIALGGHVAALTRELRREREELAAAREEERRRLHRDLHDGVGPELAGLALQLSALSCAVDQPAVRQRLVVVEETLRGAVAEVRRVVDELRPPGLDSVGLVDGLQARAASFSTPTLTFAVASCPMPRLPAVVEVAAYRIAMEAMANTARHSRAGRCEVRLLLDGTAGLLLEVTDDGVGFTPTATPGVGLASMRARALEVGGHVEISASPGGGTAVRALLPVPS